MAATTALVVAVLAAITTMWRSAPSGCGYLFCDFTTYRAGAERLAATGTPYSAAAIAGTVPEGLERLPSAFPYPPLLAQALALANHVDAGVVGSVWVLSSLIAFLAIIPLLYRSGGGKVTPISILGLTALAFAFLPLQWAFAGGNLSGWLTVAIGAMLLIGDAGAGFLAVAATALKIQPLPLVVAVAARGRRAVIGMAVGIVVVVLVPAAFAPDAWSAWPSTFGYVMRLPGSGSPGDLSLAGHLPGPITALIFRWGPAIALMVAGVWYQKRRGDATRALLAATLASICLSSPLWQHYLGMLFPFVVVLMPSLSMRRRTAIVLLVLALGVGWVWLPVAWMVGRPVAILSLVLETSLVVALAGTLLVPARTSHGATVRSGPPAVRGISAP